MPAALPRLADLRDVADGLPAGSIARGILFRSDAPRAGDETPALLPWPPEVVIDLHPDEHNSAPPWESHGTVHVLPLFARAAPTKSVGIRPNAEELADIYLTMMTPRPAAKLVQIVARTCPSLRSSSRGRHCWYLANDGDPATLELLRSRFAARRLE